MANDACSYIAFPVGEGVSRRLTDEVQLCTLNFALCIVYMASDACSYIAFPVGEGVSHRLTDEVQL